MAIVDDQRDAAVCVKLVCDCSDGGIARRRTFDDLAVAIEGKAAGRDENMALDAADMLADR